MINVTKTYLPSKEKLLEKIDRIYKKGWVTNNGELTLELQERLEEFLGVKNLLLVSNGTLALQIAYKVLGVKGEAITSPFSFVATTSSMVWEGIKPKFVDIDKDTLNINIDNIERSINKNISAIVPVHVFGNPCEIEEIQSIASKNNLKVIYDASHCFNGKFNEESILSFGDISTLSFHATKIFHTIEGGALVIRDDEVYERAKLMINFGIAGVDSIKTLGVNCKINEFQSAMGLCVLDEYEEINSKRKRVYHRYYEKLRSSNKVTLQERNPKGSLNYSYFPVLFKTEEALLKLQRILKEKGINGRRYFYPSLNTLEYLKYEKMIISEDVSKRVFCLPLYDSLDMKVVDEIIWDIESI
ncbi:DegT/DnrJ/EryC1/StrS family aminotransferase [Clostridium hydrogeniformans]|uniref:DegT/DnrJ/EryC1/StrS family aminotransferase n=1 Tax=Clostridium hydrogeniformans TaxID=349933 RepID=UPI0004895B57|nr:DegT/DnrJ/EryC1/StrS family aminotransferase [Clostridium hydrogeniformans]